MGGKPEKVGKAQRKKMDEAEKVSRQKEAAQDASWREGTEDMSKKNAKAAKDAEAARKKAEKEALLKEEEASLPTKAPKAKGGAQKKPRGPDLSQLEALDDGATPTSTRGAGLNASGVESALEALDLISGNKQEIDRHPERRFKAAYAAFEERRLEEMKTEKGLRRNQKIEQIRKEFEKHPDNPFNQLNGTYDMSKEERSALQAEKDRMVESHLVSPGDAAIRQTRDTA